MSKPNSITCPVCGQKIALIQGKTHNKYFPSLEHRDETVKQRETNQPYSESTISLSFFLCLNCDNYSIQATQCGKKTNFNDIWIQPRSNARLYPDYVPEYIQQDYKEAFLIVELSPRASAVLSRRCIQSIIRDCWNCKESNLSKAIQSISNKIDEQTLQVLNAIRQIGNAGAHPDKDTEVIVDISSEDATKLLKSIEFLIEECYITPHHKSELFNEVVGINNKLKKQSENKYNT